MPKYTAGINEADAFVFLNYYVTCDSPEEAKLGYIVNNQDLTDTSKLNIYEITLILKKD